MISTLIKSITEFFKPPIHRIITKNWERGEKNLHINLYFRNQILFQVVPSKFHVKRGIKSLNENDMSILHFFNKNKTITFNKLEKFESRISENEFIRFESDGNINFIKSVGKCPKLIEKEISKDTELYSLRDYEKENLRVEFLGFKEL